MIIATLFRFSITHFRDWWHIYFDYSATMVLEMTRQTYVLKASSNLLILICIHTVALYYKCLSMKKISLLYFGQAEFEFPTDIHYIIKPIPFIANWLFWALCAVCSRRCKVPWWVRCRPPRTTLCCTLGTALASSTSGTWMATVQRGVQRAHQNVSLFIFTLTAFLLMAILWLKCFHDQN